MEESKSVPIIIAVGKSSSLTADNIKEFLGAPEIYVETITSPKGFKVLVTSDKAQQLLQDGEDTLNGEKISFAEDDPYCTLYIKGVTTKVDEKDLTAALSEEGKICMTTLAKDSKFNPTGIAFVRFNRKDDALRAAEKFKNLTINEVPLECTKYEATSKPKTTVSASAFFKNFPSSYSEEQAYQFLGEHGQITELKLDRENGTGIVSYTSHASVAKAIQNLNGRKFEDQTFFISDNSDKKRKAANYNNLFVGGVDPDVTEEEIKAEFSKYGEIESMLRPTRKVQDENGQTKTVNKNHIFVAFKDSKAASEVIKEMDGKYFWNRKLDIDFYDADAKHGPGSKSKPGQTQNNQQMMESFMQNMMSMMATQMASSMNRGRGGYNSGNQGYRGGNNYGRGRGTRGSQRGTRGGRGGPRGGPPGGHYQVKSQYEQKPMYGGHMGPPLGGMAPPLAPPSSSYGPGMDSNMGYNPGMHSGPQPGSMQPSMPMNQPPQHQQMNEPVPSQSSDSSSNALGVNLSELNQMGKEDRDNMLGTFLYNKLENAWGGELAGKITGMFLDLPVNDIYEIATDDDTFEKYYSDAINLIKNEPADE